MGRELGSCSRCEPGKYSLGDGAPSCPLCPAGQYNIEWGQAGCDACLSSTYAGPGSSQCDTCGYSDYRQQTASVPSLPDARYGIDCAAGQVLGTLPGYWSSQPLTYNNTNETSTWKCPVEAACLGGLNSSCAEGHTGVACVRCVEGWYTEAYGKKPCIPIPNWDPSMSVAGNPALWAVTFSGLLITAALSALLMAVNYRLTANEADDDVTPPWDPDGLEENALLLEEQQAVLQSVDVKSEKGSGRGGRRGSVIALGGGEHHLLSVRSFSMEEASEDPPHVWIMHEVDGPHARKAEVSECSSRSSPGRRPSLAHHGCHLKQIVRHQSATHSTIVADVKAAQSGTSTVPFCQMLATTLRKYSMRVMTEPEDEEEAERTLSTAHICVFLLSDHFFFDERAVKLLKLAVAKSRTCIMIAMPGSKWGEKGDKTFPENAFNSTWTPFVPEVAPAFAEIAVTWESEYPHACFEELIKRASSHLQRLTGEQVVDMEAVRIKLAQAEDREVRKAAKATPVGVTLEWDWDSKTFDVFLSHKITDAKDVVLTWYNALTALGYNPFLDRLSLDAVENIPQYVRETVTFAIAVTANLWQSYWCAVELITAIDWHMQGKLNILLIPVQGEKYTNSFGATLDSPTPKIMMQNFAKWFPLNSMLTDQSRGHIEELYGGGEFTASRTVKHTLMHYKSFERLFIARCGKSIASRKMIAQLIAAGGMTVEDQAEKLAPFIFEANAIRKGKGDEERYTVRLGHGKSALGYENLADNTQLELRVVEQLVKPDDPDSTPQDLADYGANEFVQVLRKMRLHSGGIGTTATKALFIFKQWQVLEAVNTDSINQVVEVVREGLAPVREIFKSLLSFVQIGASLVLTFPTIAFPDVFKDISGIFDVFNLDFINLDLLQAALKSSTDFCSNALTIGYVFTVYLGAIAASYKFIKWKYKPPLHRKRVFLDRSIALIVLSCLMMYPILSMRILRLFATRSFGSTEVLSVDWRLEVSDVHVGGCQAQGALFIVLYVAGIPLTFLAVLYNVSRTFKPIDLTQVGAEKALAKDRRNVRRFGVLYAKFEQRCWWWEIVDTARKLILMGVLIFIAPGTVTQIWVSIALSLCFVLLQTFYMPFVNFKVDIIATSGQICTTMTLLVVLGIRLNLADEGVLVTQFTSALLVMFSVIPLCLGVYIIFDAVGHVAKLERKKFHARKKLPAVLRDDEPNIESDPLEGETGDCVENRSKSGGSRLLGPYNSVFSAASAVSLGRCRVGLRFAGSRMHSAVSGSGSSLTSNNKQASAHTPGKLSATDQSSASDSSDVPPTSPPTLIGSPSRRSQPLHNGLTRRMHSIMRLTQCQSTHLSEPSTLSPVKADRPRAPKQASLRQPPDTPPCPPPSPPLTSAGSPASTAPLSPTVQFSDASLTV